MWGAFDASSLGAVVAQRNFWICLWVQWIDIVWSVRVTTAIIIVDEVVGEGRV